MTKPARYRLTRSTANGEEVRYITVEDVDGEYLLKEEFNTVVASNLGLLDNNSKGAASSSSRREYKGRYDDLDKANSVAKALWVTYLSEGWRDAT